MIQRFRARGQAPKVRLRQDQNGRSPLLPLKNLGHI